MFSVHDHVHGLRLILHSHSVCFVVTITISLVRENTVDRLAGHRQRSSTGIHWHILSARATLRTHIQMISTGRLVKDAVDRAVTVCTERVLSGRVSHSTR